MSKLPVYLQGRGRGRGLDNKEQTPKLTQNAFNGHGRGLGQTGDNQPARNIHQADYQGLPSAQERFQVAKSQNQVSIQRHLQDDQDKGDNSSSDEDDIDNNVLEKVFLTYTSTEAVVGTARDTLLHFFRSGTAACLICIDAVRKSDPIWSCEGCRAIFHIQCIQKWVRDGVYQQVYKSEDDIQPETIPWHCPKCRLEYTQKQCPVKDYCYCGKVEGVKFDPWLVPHSCGQTCGRALKPDCGHACLLLCHPGTCPPCPQMLKVKCYCGSATPQIRRCSARPWACGSVCSRVLSCGQHKCQQQCHPGECAPCPQTSTQPCLCGKSRALRPCASPDWQCDKPCGKRLSCGNHLCEVTCHHGSCGLCPRAGVRMCPCGKTSYDLPCTDDIPTCGDTCGKLLQCGLHKCVERCHYGACGSCRQMTVKKCRCQSQKEKEVQCCKEYFCDKKCINMRDCQKHQCKRKCCDGNCPSCEQVCNKPLGCKKHKCVSRCHRGPCYPCNETVDIFCNCKATKITVPCGREKITKPPRCNYPCKNPPACHHENRIAHACHFGECPPCRLICNKPLANCKHKCPMTCHVAIKVKIKDNTPRAGPWEGGPRIIEDVINKPCPPCTVSMTMQCFGKHEIGSFPCCVVQPYQCGRPCGRKLLCGNHFCTLVCHTVSNATDPTQAGSNCQKCEVQCQFERPEGCTHPCTLPCHSGPCPDCTQMFRMRCHCQVTVKHIECYKWVSGTEQSKNDMKSCGGSCPKLLSCGHPCSFTCHPGSCSKVSLCQKKVTVKCKCQRQKREVKCLDKEAEQAILKCDDICKKEIEKKQQIEEMKNKELKELEEKRQKAELEEFERKMKGRKRKQRKQHEEVQEKNFLQRHKTLLIVVVCVIVLAVSVYFIVKDLSLADSDL